MSSRIEPIRDLSVSPPNESSEDKGKQVQAPRPQPTASSAPVTLDMGKAIESVKVASAAAAAAATPKIATASLILTPLLSEENASISHMPDELLLNAFKDLDILALGSMGRTNKALKAVSEDNVLWANVARKVGFSNIPTVGAPPGSVKKEFKARYWRLFGDVCHARPVHVGLAEIYSYKLSIESLKFFQILKPACDTLHEWQELSRKLHVPLTFSWDNAGQVIEQAEGFSAWVRLHQTEVIQLLINELVQDRSDSYIFFIPDRERRYILAIKYLEILGNVTEADAVREELIGKYFELTLDTKCWEGYKGKLYFKMATLNMEIHASLDKKTDRTPMEESKLQDTLQAAREYYGKAEYSCNIGVPTYLAYAEEERRLAEVDECSIKHLQLAAQHEEEAKSFSQKAQEAHAHFMRFELKR